MERSPPRPSCWSGRATQSEKSGLTLHESDAQARDREVLRKMFHRLRFGLVFYLRHPRKRNFETHKRGSLARGKRKPPPLAASVPRHRGRGFCRRIDASRILPHSAVSRPWSPYPRSPVACGRMKIRVCFPEISGERQSPFLIGDLPFCLRLSTRCVSVNAAHLDSHHSNAEAAI